MKKIFSLIFVALLTMSAWADTTVVVDFNDQGWESNTLVTELTIDDVSLTFDNLVQQHRVVRPHRLDEEGGVHLPGFLQPELWS